MRVVLIGYMGSGKTTTGRLLALYSRVKFYDLDEYISIRERQSVRDIFLTKGEDYFRKAEALSLQALLKSEEEFVISSGGGTPCHKDNLSLMKRSAQTVYLRLSPELIFQRLRTKKSKRPLIAGLSDKELYKFVFRNLAQRTSFYEQADYKVEVIDKLPAQVACCIRQQLFPSVS